jgi:hypothetical protein
MPQEKRAKKIICANFRKLSIYDKKNNKDDFEYYICIP